MGLDVLEFMLNVEKSFHVHIPDPIMETLTTPRQLIDFLAAHLKPTTEHVCLSQRVFYQLRSSVAARVGCPRSSLRPDTSLVNLIPPCARAILWEGVRQDLGAAGPPLWPRLEARGWFDLFRSPRVGTLREATKLAVTHFPHATKIAKGHGAGWTRTQIAEVVHGLICENFGLQQNWYTEDSHWNRDMGVY